MRLFNVYAIEGDFLGTMSSVQITQWFADNSGKWISIHGNRESWPGVPSGEFNSSSWDEWREQHDRVEFKVKPPTLYETTADMFMSATLCSKGVSEAVLDAMVRHARVLLAMPEAEFEEIHEWLQDNA